ncbi:HAD family hydrolase [Actinoplanes sp. NPDC051411]|uniref:HAD family hydrolase n=1 Tax=Actinoplanes sp. NPDC051411 TaxID=3155522 RepID=UPI00343C5D26
MSIDGEVCGGLLLTDTVRPSAAGAVREMGLRTVLLTSDDRAAADAVGVDEALPAGKADTIEHFPAEGRVVAMVGAGIDGAPALVRADCGLAVVTGTDGVADIILVRDDLDAAPTAIALARRTIRIKLVWGVRLQGRRPADRRRRPRDPLISSAAIGPVLDARGHQQPATPALTAFPGRRAEGSGSQASALARSRSGRRGNRCYKPGNRAPAQRDRAVGTPAPGR